jgi:hypothetical protein
MIILQRTTLKLDEKKKKKKRGNLLDDLPYRYFLLNFAFFGQTGGFKGEGI